MKTYAKINLGLLVLGRRPDGYHEIRTIFHRVNVADGILLEPSPSIEVESDDPAAPGGEANICHKAALMMREALGCTKGVRILLRKHIPVGAGLGGGSADAALLLLSLPEFWKSPSDPKLLRTIAERLGSDVPFFLGTTSAAAAGRGEQLQYFDLDIPFTILLCNPNIHVSTAWAYGQIRPGSGKTVDLRDIVERGMRDPRILRDGLRNDFESAVFGAYPTIREIKESMLRGGAEFALMSGSGSTVFGLFADHGRVEAVSAQLGAKGYRTFITPPHFRPLL